MFDWYGPGCPATVTGYRNMHIRTHVHSVPERGEEFCQKVKIQMDYRPGPGDLLHHVDADRPPHGQTIRAKAKVYLKKVDRFRDTTVWACTVTSGTWDCGGAGRGSNG